MNFIVPKDFLSASIATNQSILATCLYKEDFDKFKDGFEDVLNKISELRETGNYKEDNPVDYSSEVKFEDL